MRAEDLTRALHDQADEAMAAAPPLEFGALVARRARARRRAVVGGAVAATLAVMAAVTVFAGDPTDRGAERPDPVGRPSETPSATSHPSPSAGPTEPASADWQPASCRVAGTSDCDIPMTLTYRGRTWTRDGEAGGSQPVRWHNGVNREIALSVVPIGAPQLVLVGATRSGPGSRLSVSVNWASSRPVDAGPLTPVLLEITPDSQHVTVREDGTAPRDEVLRIVTYRPET